MLTCQKRNVVIKTLRVAVLKSFNGFLLFVMILTNFTGVTFAKAAHETLPRAKENEHGDYIYRPQTHLRPEPRIGERPNLNSHAQIIDATLQCIEPDCTDKAAGVTLTETFDYSQTKTIFDYAFSRTGFSFHVKCGDTNCSRDVYYRITGTMDWVAGGLPGIGPARSVNIGVGGKTYVTNIGTGYVDIDCGTAASGICSISAQGVIQAALQHDSPVEVFGQDYGFTVTDYHHKHYTIQVSLDPDLLGINDPNLLGNDLPIESTVCKDCPLGQAQGFAADPINTYSGVFSYPVDDLSINTSAGSLGFKHTYISYFADDNSSALGYGWRHNLDIRLIFSSSPGGKPGFVLFQSPAGNRLRFWDIGNGTYTPYSGVSSTLTKNSDTYTLQDASHNVYIFDAGGKLITLTTPENHSFSYTYDSNNRLSHVSADNNTRFLDLIYNSQAQLGTVTDHTGRSISFTYNSAGDLVSHADVFGHTWTYTYDSNHYLLEVIDPQNKPKLRNEYALVQASDITPSTRINFNDYPPTPYADRDLNPIMTIEDDGNTLHLEGDSWKKISLPYTLTPTTTVEFDFKSSEQGAMHGIGLISSEYDEMERDNNVFNLYGTNGNWGIGFDSYINSAPDWKHYKISVGEYYTGQKSYIVFANDSGTLNTNNSYFKNLKVYEDMAITGEARNYSDYEVRIVRQYDGENNLVVELQYNLDGTRAVTDAFGHQTNHTYDARGTLTESTDPLNAPTQKTYNSNFHPTAITDPNDNTSSLTWDGANLTRVVDAAGNQTDITYDSLNNPTSVIDAREYLTTYTYSGKLLTSTTNALNQTTSYTYTPEGYLASVTDALNHATSYTYDSHGQRVSMTDPSNNTWTYSYDALGRMIDTIDPLGHITRNQYDAAGRLTKVTRNYTASKMQNADNGWNIVTEYAYDVRGNQISATDTYGRVMQYEYDDADRLVKTTDPAGNIIANTYNNAGQLISTTDPLGRVTQYEYDAAGRLLSTIDPLDNSVITTYNPDGTVASTTDALGRETSYVYDELRRVIIVTQPNGAHTHNTYDEVGNLATVTDALGNVTTYRYDALNRLIKTIDPMGNFTENFYNSVGQLIQTKDARGNATTYAYDAAGRQVSVTDALGHVTSYGYDVLGRRTTVTDANGNVTHYTYDELDRVVSVTDPLGNTVYTEYDALGQVLARADANGNEVTFDYDDLGRTTSQTDAMGGVTSFMYDAAGNHLTTTDPRGSLTSTTYDALNRPVAVVDPLGNSTSTTYDAAGQVTASVNAVGGQTDFAYNVLGAQAVVTDPLGNETHYEYDSAGRMTTMMDAEGVVTAYEYDALGRLTAVIENYSPAELPDYETNIRTEYTYDENGNRLTIKDGNGHFTSFVYDKLNRLINESDALGNTWTYTYDALGNRVSMTDANGVGTNYTYDDANQLTVVSDQSSVVGFQYDAGGRRISMTDSVGTTAWTYDSLNRPTAISDPFGKTVGYTYDAVGNRTGLTYPDGRQMTYTYNNANYLTTVNDLSSTVSYTYDPLGRLQEILRSNGVISAYTYDAASRLTALQHTSADAALSSFQYTYDSVGNRVQAVENVNNPIITPTPTFTPTSIPINTATFTPTDTPTSTPTDIATATLEIPTSTPTYTYTPSPTSTNTSTVTPAFTPSVTPTPSLTATPVSSTFVVTKTQDTRDGSCNSDCSLREALIAANAAPGANTIILPAGAYTLSLSGSDDSSAAGDLDITGEVTIVGSGTTSTLIGGGTGWSDRILDVISTTVTLSNLTIQNGIKTSNTGAGIQTSNSTLTLSNVILKDNHASSGGGAIYLGGGSLTMTNSAIVNNTADFGAGIYNYNGSVSLTNVTISGNTAKRSGGGLYQSSSSGTISLVNVTISSNTADGDADNNGDGGGLYRSAGTVTLKNTIIAGNADSSTSTVRPDCYGTVQSQGHNLVGINNCTFTPGTGDKVGTSGSPVNALLDPLADNGGDTLTHSQQSSSPAINAGDNDGCPAADQRGFTRDASCDIGAFEFIGTPAPTPTNTPTSTPTFTPTITPTSTATFTNVFTPIDDAYIASASPASNYGSETRLKTDNSPVLQFLLKFNVTGVNGQQVTNAKIRLYNKDGSTVGGNFYRVNDNTWQEETVTWNTKPAADTTLLASLGAVSPDNWYEVDVTSLITGDGTYSLLVSSTSTNGADYASKEDEEAPQLVVTLGATAYSPSNLPGIFGPQNISLLAASQSGIFEVSLKLPPIHSKSDLPYRQEAATPTETPTEAPTDTPLPSETPSAIPTGTPPSSETPTETPTDSPTSTSTPSICTSWNLASEFRTTPDQENPNRDSCNNLGVWNFMESTSLTRDPSSYTLISTFSNSSWVGVGDVPVISSTMSGSSRVVNVHPAPSKMAVIGWRSPINGYVSITGGVTDLDAGWGDGIAWFIDRNATNLAYGSYNEGGAQLFSAGMGAPKLNTVAVNAGDMLYFAIDPKANYYFDSTRVNISIVTVPAPITPTLKNTRTPTPTPRGTKTAIPTSTPRATLTPFIPSTPQPGSGKVIINYTYDPLYRLTAADYSTGDFYHYAYDSVGNRLSQESTVHGLPSTVNYAYDNANRLTSAGGVNYTWDNNGNLLDDGTNTYTYDSANRLITVSGEQGVESSYTYNGLGDRLTTDGVHYTLDLNTGLTQVLSDGTNTYTYGVGRISQTDATTEYFLNDALGSVRQMVNPTGAVTFAQTYDPYGTITATAGTSHTEYGFTGEQQDSYTNLVYLRARYYNVADGRFQSRDTWEGKYNRPLSLNKWMYAFGNPVRFIDPTGYYNRQAAVDYAMGHDGAGFEPRMPGFQCTNMISFALWEGGIRDPRPDPRDPANDEYYKDPSHLKYDKDDAVPSWQPPYWSRDIIMNSPFDTYRYINSREWYYTDELVDFLTNIGVQTFGESKPYTGAIPHFKYTLAPNGNRNNQDWTRFLVTNRSSIQPGDLVFYKWDLGGNANWDHVAMITGWDVQTYFDEEGTDPWTYHVAELLYMAQIDPFICSDPGYDYNVLKPRVVDADGGIKYHDSRSIDNTSNQILQIMIIHMR